MPDSKEMNFAVNYVYDNYEKFCHPRKAKRLQWFKRSYTEFLEFIINGGSEYSKTDYYKYLYSRRRRSESEASKHRNIMKIMRTEADLYFDIEKNGMRDPFDMVKVGARFEIVKGNRRLMILKFMGIKTFPARINENIPETKIP